MARDPGRRKLAHLAQLDPDACLTVEEVAEVLGCTDWTVRKLLNNKQLHGRKPPGLHHWRVRVGDVRHYLAVAD